MLKKKTGAGFKPKAPIRRNVSSSSVGPERSATAERQSNTPGPVHLPSSRQHTPASSLSRQHSAVVANDGAQVQQTPVPRPIEDGRAVGGASATRPAVVRNPATTPTSAIESTSTAPTSARDTAPRSSNLRQTTPSSIISTQSNIDPTLRDPGSSGHAPVSSSVGPASEASLLTPASTAPPAQRSTHGAMTATSSAQVAQVATPPAEGSASQPRPSVEAAGDGQIVPPTASSAKAKGGRKRKSAATTATGENGEAAVPARKRARKENSAAGADAESNGVAGQAAAPAPKKRGRKPRVAIQGQTNDENGADDVAEQSGPAKKPVRHRSVTPEDAEKMEVDIRQVKMGDLIKDLRIGKKFSRHDELIERERKARQKTYQERKLKEAGLANGDGANASGNDGAPTPPADAEPATPAPPPPAPTGMAPQFQIIDGQIVLNSDSLQYDRHAAAAEAAGELEEEIEDDFTHRTTSLSYLKRPATRGHAWTPAETERFYRALGMLGTDFQLISKLFPGKSRRHVKLKFNREERAHPARVTAALVGEKTVAIDLAEIGRAAGEQYQTVADIEAEQRRAEEEFEERQRRADEEAAEEARRKREQLYGASGADAADATAAAASGADAEAGGSRSRPGRGAKAREAVPATAAPTVREDGPAAAAKSRSGRRATRAAAA